MKGCKFMKKITVRLLALVLSCVCSMSLLPAGMLVGSAAVKTPIKTKGTIYTEKEIATCRTNVKKYNWASATKNSYCASADKMIANGIDFYYLLMSSNEVWRSYYVSETNGCPNCGLDVYDYGNKYNIDFVNKPFKITCPACSMVFPTNDFESYYKSGLDEHYVFNPQKANKQYLKNVSYPEKGEYWGVDDGTGVVIGGTRYTVIGWYTNQAWSHIYGVLNTLKFAYLYSGEQKYATFGIAILSRIADLYPTMDPYYEKLYKEFVASNGGNAGYGKIKGRIDEAVYFGLFADAYDAFFYGFNEMAEKTSQEVYSFLQKRSPFIIKTTDDIKINIEQNLILQCYPNILLRNICGNMGYQQSSLAACAVCMDDPQYTIPWLDFIFQTGNGADTGGNMNNLLISAIDRDGFGNEAAPHYNSGWLSKFIELAQYLKGYSIVDDISKQKISYDLYQNPKFKKMFLSMLHLLISDTFTPQIGDTEQTGNPKVFANTGLLLGAYINYKDPIYAQAVYYLCGGNITSLRGDIFDENPEAIAAQIQAVIDQYGELEPNSNNLTGFGFAILRNRFTSTSVVYESVNNATYALSELKYISSDQLALTPALAVFKPVAKGDSITIGFDWKNASNTYELILRSNGNSTGTFHYLDGKLLQTDVDAKDQSNIYFSKTCPLSMGMHLLTLEAAETVGTLELAELMFNLQSTETPVAFSKSTETTAAVYYGRNSGHGHKDTLNLFLYAYNVDLAPDLGTPEYKNASDPHNHQFVDKTISHNTVIVDEFPQENSIVATSTHFDDSDYVKVVDVNATQVYPQCSVYGRTVATIQLNATDTYVVDFFRVKGGKSHIYNFHSAENNGVVTSGLNLVKQVNDAGEYVGSYAGKDITWGNVNANGESLNTSRGFQWLKNIQKDTSPASVFSFDWTIKDTYATSKNHVGDIHLKMTMLGTYDEVALTVGIPPRNKVGNPKALDYVLVKRESNSSNLESVFVSVLEPYDDNTGSAIVSIEEVGVTKNGTAVTSMEIKAVKITTTTGRVDYVVSSYDNKTLYNIDGKFDFCGFFGVYTLIGKQIITYLHDGSVIGTNTATASYSGKVVDFTKELSFDNTIKVQIDGNVHVDDLAGRYFYGDSKFFSNPSYRIESAKKNSDGTYTLNIGDVSLISAYKNPYDTKGGYQYNILEDISFTIPLSATGGNVGKITSSVKKSNVTSVILSHDIKKGAKAGDFVGYLYMVDSQFSAGNTFPTHTIVIDETYGDWSYFKVKDNKLYMAKDSDQTTYTLRLLVSSSTDEEGVYYKADLFIRQTSKEQLYYTFVPDPTKLVPFTDLAGSEIGDDHHNQGGMSPWIWISIGGGILIIGAVASLIIFKKKKK